MNDLTPIFVELVRNHLAVWCKGVVPVDRAGLAEKILESYMPSQLQKRSPFTPAEWCKERAEVENYIRAAVEQVAGSEPRWLN